MKWNKKFSYKPHITIAKFKTKEEQRIALKEIINESVSFSFRIDSFELLEVSEDFKKIISKKKFKLAHLKIN